MGCSSESATVAENVEVEKSAEPAVETKNISAPKKLAEENISVRLLDMHTIKPLDVDAVKDCIEKIGKIVTVEDHNIINGLGTAVCEVVAEVGKGKVKRIGIQDKFGESAVYERLMEKNGITVEEIVKAAKGF